MKLMLAALLVLLLALFWPSLSHLRPWQSQTYRMAVVDEVQRPAATRTEWSSYRGAEGAGQYSSLAEITLANVTRLRRVWMHHYGDVGSVSAGTASAYETTPIFANSMLYFCNPFGRLFALDPRNGRERWSIDVHAITGVATKREICRGVSYWAQRPGLPKAPCGKRIFMGDVYGRLYSLDADTGKLCKDFGRSGFIDLNELDYLGSGAIYLTSPPAIFQDLLITGCAIDDNERTDAPHGIVRALDVRTGRQVWSFDPIPAKLSRMAGGANVWAGLSIDSVHGIVYLPTSSPSADSYGGTRTHDIPYANAIVALNAATGAVRWHFQTIHHDLFDYDLPTEPALFDLRRGEEQVPALAQVTKTGFVYVLHRLTGKPLFPIEERPVPVSDVPGEVSARTQPMPMLPQAFARQRVARADLFGLTWLDRAACQSRFDRLRYEGPFTPPSLEGSLIFPSAAGGANWGAAALDPVRQRLVVRSQNIGSIVRLIPASPEVDRNALASPFARPLWGTPFRQTNGYFVSPLGIPCIAPPWGELTAIDLDTGRIAWQVPLGTVRKGLFTSPSIWGSPGLGGPMISAGGLVFVGATLDPKLRAFDIDSGKLVWQAELPAPAVSVPMTYEIDGQQYVAVAAGGSAFAETELADTLVAFALTTCETCRN